MKKTINLILVLLLTLILSSCFTSQDDVNKAKQDLWIIELDNTDNDSWSNLDMEVEKAKQDLVNEEEKVEEIKKIEIKSLTTEQFLELDDLSDENLLDWEVEITWKTLTHVDKIVVSFANETSDFPVDNYTLKQFTPWMETFLYRAFSRYETLDFWKNVYVFEAYSWDKVSKLELIINVIKEEEKEVSEKVEQVFEDISLDTLPIKETFWTPIDLWNWKVSYTDLKWFELRRSVNPNLTCENLTSELVDSIDSWFFWNTCRPIDNNEWISFFVIRLDWDKYVYEKHYYLSYEWLYWVQQLETWTWVDNKNIGEKNTELKEKNEDFTILKIVDDLFNEILN